MRVSNLTITLRRGRHGQMFSVSAIVVHKHGSKYTFCSHTKSNAHVLPRLAQQLPLSFRAVDRLWTTT